ncbi:MAG: methylated-DNA--[protein]-cysteine S-methyltransferase [Chloroflexi bacterium]|nr:methylated-DNA--[protein]-cysteine S-methyltransferase [Chloroflexota bacterium]
MKKTLKHAIFPTRDGFVGVLASEKGLLSITFPRSSTREAREELGEQVNDAIESPDCFADLIKRLTVYFGGSRVLFHDRLDLGDATPFQRKVWEAARLIPYGETRSYRWVAERIGRPGAARAVGQALAKNPLPIIIPCHRVVASSGELGGFSGGLQMKDRLLRLEGILVHSTMRGVYFRSVRHAITIAREVWYPKARHGKLAASPPRPPLFSD